MSKKLTGVFLIFLILLLAGYLVQKNKKKIGHFVDKYVYSNKAGKAKDSFLICGGPRGGTYEKVSLGMGEAITDYSGSLTGLINPSAGTVDNVIAIGGRGCSGAMGMLDTVTDGVTGQKPFKKSYDLALIAKLYPNQTHLVVRGDNIKTVADLRGKVVATGAAGSGIEIVSNRILKIAGLNPDKDIVRRKMTPKESSFAMENGHLDAFFLVGGVPTAELANLANKVSIKLIPTAEFTEQMNILYVKDNGVNGWKAVKGYFFDKGKMDLYSKGVIKAGTYRGVDYDVPTADVWNVLFVREDADEDHVYKITKAVFDGKAEMVKRHKAMDGYFTVDNQVGSSIPYHPGALKFFAEAKKPGYAAAVSSKPKFVSIKKCDVEFCKTQKELDDWAAYVEEEKRFATKVVAK